MLRQILAVKQFEKQAHVSLTRGCVPPAAAHPLSQGDGCILFELMAFGTAVPDAEHRANCL